MIVKKEFKDIAVQAAVATPTGAWAMITSLNLAQWIALILGALQAAYLVRKWWREETEWGLQMRDLIARIKLGKKAGAKKASDEERQ